MGARRRSTNYKPEYCELGCNCCPLGAAAVPRAARTGSPSRRASRQRACHCGNCDVLDDTIGKFALAYARQTDQDCRTLDKARRTGRIAVAAREGVK